MHENIPDKMQYNFISTRMAIIKNIFRHILVVPAIKKTEAGELLESRSSSPA
jgi:hypothetical protein